MGKSLLFLYWLLPGSSHWIGQNRNKAHQATIQAAGVDATTPPEIGLCDNEGVHTSSLIKMKSRESHSEEVRKWDSSGCMAVMTLSGCESTSGCNGS